MNLIFCSYVCHKICSRVCSNVCLPLCVCDTWLMVDELLQATSVFWCVEWKFKIQSINLTDFVSNFTQIFTSFSYHILNAFAINSIQCWIFIWMYALLKHLPNYICNEFGMYCILAHSNVRVVTDCSGNDGDDGYMVCMQTHTENHIERFINAIICEYHLMFECHHDRRQSNGSGRDTNSCHYTQIMTNFSFVLLM